MHLPFLGFERNRKRDFNRLLNTTILVKIFKIHQLSAKSMLVTDVGDFFVGDNFEMLKIFYIYEKSRQHNDSVANIIKMSRT